MNFEKRIKDYVRKSDEICNLYMKIKAKQGYVFYPLEDGCNLPNYEVKIRI